MKPKTPYSWQPTRTNLFLWCGGNFWDQTQYIFESEQNMGFNLLKQINFVSKYLDFSIPNTFRWELPISSQYFQTIWISTNMITRRRAKDKSRPAWNFSLVKVPFQPHFCRSQHCEPKDGSGRHVVYTSMRSATTCARLLLDYSKRNGKDLDLCCAIQGLQLQIYIFVDDASVLSIGVLSACEVVLWWARVLRKSCASSVLVVDTTSILQLERFLGCSCSYLAFTPQLKDHRRWPHLCRIGGKEQISYCSTTFCHF